MSNTEALKKIATVIDGYFKPSFLFDEYHTAWRQRVSPAEGTEEHAALAATAEGVHEAPLVRFGSVIAYDDVSSAIRNAANDSELTEDISNALVKEALTAFSKLLTVVDDAALGPCARLVKLLSEDDNPIHRTIHMKPVHQQTTEDDIRSFVVKHLINTVLKTQQEEFVSKLITGVSKRSMVDVSAHGVSRTVFYAHVEFIKKDTATLFINTKPSYVAADPISQHYLPSLKVKILSEHKKEFDDIEARREAERSRHTLFRAAQTQEHKQGTQQLLEAKLAASAAAAASSTGSSSPAVIPTAASVQVTEQFLSPGKTLKIPNLPANVTWRDVKVKLSNLFPDEKRLIRVVKEHEGAAFVVLFSPEKLQPLLSAWAAETYIHNIIPSLVKVEGEEEKWAIKEYPSWVGGFVTKKVIKNAKFAAKRLRDE